MSAREIASLNSMEVYRLAKKVAEKNGLRKPDYPVLRREMLGAYPQPVVLDSHNGRLWVDRFYIAFQLDGYPGVKYVYAARHHILEETAAYRVSAKRGDARHTMPEEIDRQFNVIRQKMLASGSEIWVDPSYDLRNINTENAGVGLNET